MRDITLEDTFYMDFTTRAFATGIPTVLAGTPVLSVLEENNVTPITAGVSVSVDRASVVGLNMATLVATAANGYEDGKGYSVYISTGTVGGVSVIGEVVGQFTIGASAAAVDLANGTDGLGAIKTETALIVADTNELQTDDVPGLIAALDAVVDTVKAETALIVADTNELQTDDVPGLIAALDAVVDTVKAETALIVADTNELQTDDIPGLIAALDAVVDTVKAETVLILADTADIQPNYATSTALATVDTVVDGIQTDLDNGTDGLGAIKTDTAAILVDTGTSGVALLAATQASIDAIEIDTSTTLPGIIDDLAVKKNATFSNFEFLMVLTSDHVTPATGLTVTGQRSIDGAAFAGVTGTIAEVSNGIYQFDAVAADTNGDLITWRFLSATADDTFVTFKTVA